MQILRKEREPTRNQFTERKCQKLDAGAVEIVMKEYLGKEEFVAGMVVAAQEQLGVSNLSIWSFGPANLVLELSNSALSRRTFELMNAWNDFKSQTIEDQLRESGKSNTGVNIAIMRDIVLGNVTAVATF